MEERRILEEILELLENNGVQVRKDHLGGGGGLCNVKEGRLFFQDMDSPPLQVAALAANALAETVDIELIYLRPEIREFVDAHCGHAGWGTE